MLLENSENEETFLIYLFEWEPGLMELNSNFLLKWDTLLVTHRVAISFQISLFVSLYSIKVKTLQTMFLKASCNQIEFLWSSVIYTS